MEIKFRGKQVDSGEWYVGFYAKGRHGGHYILSEYNGLETNAHSVDGDTVGRYASLKDRNGADVFEGDIVRASYSITLPAHHAAPESTEEHKNAVCQVVFENAQYRLRNPKSLWCKGLCWAYDLEVIGNIHDNPGLLEVAA